MEEIDMEEGEACCYKDDASTDPDTDFSYIDEKLQNYLGHFRKDFEGEVSDDNLGAKFGGYGSFLPTYQRSPLVRSQLRSPRRIQSHGSYPNNLDSEDVPQNLQVPPAMAVSNGPVPAAVAIRACEKVHLKNKLSVVKSDSSTGSLKVRIKVRPDRKEQKNFAIYSSLGLISPFSSTGNSFDKSCGVPTESQETLSESPGSILQRMTSYAVPRNLLLSPLNESLLCLLRKENDLLKGNCELPQKNFSQMELQGKKPKPVAKSETIVERQKPRSFDLKKCQQSLLNEVKIKLISSSINDSVDSSTGAARATEDYREVEKDIPVKKTEIKKDWAREKLLPANMAKKEALDSIYGKGGDKQEQDFKSKSMERNQETCAGRVPVESREMSKGGRSKVRLGSKPKAGKLRSGVKAPANIAKIIQRDVCDGHEACGDDRVKDQNLEELQSKRAPIPEPSTEQLPHEASGIDLEEWVCCDCCEKWRLLPFGTKPEELPDKWLCSMLNWL